VRVCVSHFVLVRGPCFGLQEAGGGAVNGDGAARLQQLRQLRADNMHLQDSVRDYEQAMEALVATHRQWVVRRHTRAQRDTESRGRVCVNVCVRGIKYRIVRLCLPVCERMGVPYRSVRMCL
jgi:hypothetical protein